MIIFTEVPKKKIMMGKKESYLVENERKILPCCISACILVHQLNICQFMTVAWTSFVSIAFFIESCWETKKYSSLQRSHKMHYRFFIRHLQHSLTVVLTHSQMSADYKWTLARGYATPDLVQFLTKIVITTDMINAKYTTKKFCEIFIIIWLWKLIIFAYLRFPKYEYL